jgi:CDAN1-interacting nuclease 1
LTHELSRCSSCIFNDIQDGVIIDMVRYSIGEEYEVKLKKMARDAGLTFYDEGDLRRGKLINRSL